MKLNTLLLPLFAGLLLSISACGPSRSEYEAERERADSLQRLSEIQRLDLMEINSFVDDVNQSLDSISQQEMELVFARTNSDGVALTRHEVMSNLSKFQMMLQRQHARILTLQDSLHNLSLSENASKSQVVKLTKMMQHCRSATQRGRPQSERIQSGVSQSGTIGSHSRERQNDLQGILYHRHPQESCRQGHCLETQHPEGIEDEAGQYQQEPVEERRHAHPDHISDQRAKA